MEIVDYLRIARRRLGILVAVPMLAGLITAAVVLLQPRTYVGTAVIGAPALVGGAVTNQYAGAQGVSQFTAAFTAAADSPAVLARVADATRQNASEIADNLTIAPIGSSAFLRVTYSNPRAAVAGDVARTAASETMRYLFGSQVTLAQRHVDQAQADLDRINKDLADLFKKTGTLDPEKLYGAKLQQIVDLEIRQQDYSATGQSGAAASIASSISLRRQELAKLAPSVQRVKELTTQADRVKGALVSLQQNLLAAQAQADAADPDRVITLTDTVAVGWTSALLQKVPPAIGAGLFLAVGLVVVVEMTARRRSVAVPEREHAGVFATTRAWPS